MFEVFRDPGLIFVLAVHVLVALFWSGKLWDVSNVPMSEMLDIERLFRGKPSLVQPAVIRSNRLWRRLLRLGLFLVFIGLLLKNYLVSHHSGLTAFVFLGLTILCVEMRIRWYRRSLRENLKYCQRAEETRRQ
ncbi:MAG: hypothetical protein KBA91_00750 [Candidatus Moranbacteria bacterium]|jgi:hypothetical protein|nr:hypothetical protein [Candidatus Moranbacteria bacterium]